MSAQINPLSNPWGVTYQVANGDFNNETYINVGTLEIQGGVSFVNNGTINNEGTGRTNNFGTFTNSSSGIINNEFNAYFNSSAVFLNEGTFANSGSLYLTNLQNDAGATLSNYSGSDQNGVINLVGDWNENKGTINNYGTINVDGTLYNYASIKGTGQINGDVVGGGDLSPGASAGGLLVNGSLTHSEGGTKFIELAGDSDAGRDRVNTEYDFLDVSGDFLIDGGILEVSLIDGFELGLDQEFMIAKVDGELTGTYEGLKEGAIVGSFDSVYGQIGMNLFITYEAGDGNDIALYTADNLFGLSNI